jgi:hypothetical protein
MFGLPGLFVVQVGLAPMPEPYFRALREIEVETAVGQASILRLHFDLSRTLFGDFDALVIDLFRPLVPITIRVATGPGIPQCIINAYITETRLSVPGTPGATLEVMAMDALGTRMAHVEEPHPWPNMSDDKIVARIFAKYAMIPATVQTPPLRIESETTTTQRGTDAAILNQLAGRHGYSLYIQPEPVTGRDIGHFHPPLMPPKPPQGVLSVDFGTQTNMRNFSVTNDMMRPTTVIGAPSDPRSRLPVPIVAPASTEMPMGLQPTLSRIIPPRVEVRYGTDSASPQEAQFEALARATESSRSITASGEVDGLKYARPLFVGVPVLIRGAGRQYSGLYQVERVTHRISRDSYTQSINVWRNAVGLTGAEIFVDPLAAA